MYWWNAHTTKLKTGRCSNWIYAPVNLTGPSNCILSSRCIPYAVLQRPTNCKKTLGRVAYNSLNLNPGSCVSRFLSMVSTYRLVFFNARWSRLNAEKLKLYALAARATVWCSQQDAGAAAWSKHCQVYAVQIRSEGHGLVRSLAAAGAARGLRPAAEETAVYLYCYLRLLSAAPAMEIICISKAEVVRLQWFFLRAPGAHWPSLTYQTRSGLHRKRRCSGFHRGFAYAKVGKVNRKLKLKVQCAEAAFSRLILPDLCVTSASERLRKVKLRPLTVTDGNGSSQSITQLEDHIKLYNNYSITMRA